MATSYRSRTPVRRSIARTVAGGISVWRGTADTNAPSR